MFWEGGVTFGKKLYERLAAVSNYRSENFTVFTDILSRAAYTRFFCTNNRSEKGVEVFGIFLYYTKQMRASE